MRRLIVKYFALNYMFTTKKGNVRSYLRATTPTSIAFCFMALMIGLDEDYPYLSTGDYLAMIPFAICIFLGFRYFKGNNVKWDELDTVQKWQYGSSNAEHLGTSLSIEEDNEWDTIDGFISSVKQYKPLILSLVVGITTAVLFIYKG